MAESCPITLLHISDMLLPPMGNINMLAISPDASGASNACYYAASYYASRGCTAQISL